MDKIITVQLRTKHKPKTTGNKMGTTIEDKQFINWIVENYGLKRNTAQNYNSARKKPAHTSHNRGQELFEEFSGQPNAITEDHQILQKTIEDQKRYIRKQNAKLDLLRDQYEREKQERRRLIDQCIEKQEQIEKLRIDNKSQIERIEFLQTTEAEHKRQIFDLEKRIDERRRIVVVNFTDDSVMGFPRFLRLEQLSETINSGQIKSMQIIDVDWQLTNEDK